MGKNIMAAVLQLRKILPPLYCSLCSPGHEASVGRCMSYVNLHHFIQRHKSTIKKPIEKNIDIEKHYDTEHGSEFSNVHIGQLSDYSPENEESYKYINQNSVHISDNDELASKDSSSLIQNETKVYENEIKQGPTPAIGITSVNEVLGNLRRDMYKDGQKVNTETVGSLLPKESLNSLSNGRPDVHGKDEKFLKNTYKTRITYTRKKSCSTDIFTKKKKIIVFGSERNSKKVDVRGMSTEEDGEKTQVNTDSHQTNKPSEAGETGSPNKKYNKFSLGLKEDKKGEDTCTNDSLPGQCSSSYCKNAIGIQTLSSSLADQIFSTVTPKDAQEAQEDLERSRDHLQAHGLWNKESSVIPDYDLKLPPLEDPDLDQHFRVIAEEQCAPYKDLLNQLVGADLPYFPSEWHFYPGWTRYNSDGTYTQVDFPDCHAIVFDVEVCVKEGSQPTLATAVSDKYWYSWCSQCLVHPEKEHSDSFTLEDLIPLQSSDTSQHHENRDVPRVVVGHNVSYDRIRVREQYFMEGTSLRFVDTMSLHIAASGLVSEQRTLVMKNKNSDKKIRLPWMFVGCQNSLNEVYKFYCRAEDLKKSTRDVFVKGKLEDVRNDFQNLMKYCANDVKATQMVLVKLLPLFFDRFPHPVTFAGMLEMGLTFLPVTENWDKYVTAAESEFRHIEELLNKELVKQVQTALGYMENKQYEKDPWLWNLDWSVPKGRVKKLPGYPNWYRKLCARTGEREGTPEPENMSTGLQVVPKLLRLTWDGLPLHYERHYGWGYLKPLYNSINEIPQSKIPPVDNNTIKDSPCFPIKALYEMCSGKKEYPEDQTELSETDNYSLLVNEEDWELCSQNQTKNVKTPKQESKQEERLRDIGIPGVAFVPLPHKDGASNRVGNPLAKDFLNKIEDKTLSSHFGDLAELVLKTTKTLSYWKNNRDRIKSQMVVWHDHHNLPPSVTSADGYQKTGKYGVIVPMVVTAGTITRRAVERTWMTASNAYSDRIGSELKAMVEAPPGYKFVGADVDSQELWIAAVLGDAYFSGEHGATALGWMTLQGKKSDGTDLHSHTARNAGISRDHAKVINYGRIYGAGLRFTQRLLKQFNPKMSDAEIKERAENLFATTKGQKGWCLNQQGEEQAIDMNYPFTGEPLSRKQINRLLWEARKNNIEATFDDVVERPPVWIGGSESHMFNCLEAIARCEEPRTPVLGARITRPLEPYYVDDQFMTSRVNWVVQSSAVDYLHIMLVCMRWLFTKYKISGRFCISIHDEVRYMVSSEDCYRVALALQIT
ncbi:DNA polymerase subunit gamma-1-like isoform X1 [Homarus americanus]|uniref:DNA polymerase subunit gamma-1 n=1 Tax=Homarus americanus TaxID=6706 RepID=A0A8J5KEI6_HOMAM|nr:DNA polymerase subunit gamma-1-like isoform X1 [Homarus americanus]KAG7170816.1 DNA polymerase subunit gamma-1-like [Homarus americanus]